MDPAQQSVALNGPGAYQVSYSGVFSATPLAIDWRQYAVDNQPFNPLGVFIDNAQGTGPLVVTIRPLNYSITCPAGATMQAPFPAPKGQTASVVGLGQASVVFVNFGVAPFQSNAAGSTPVSNEPANLVYAGPVSGAAALPTFRALVVADIPALPESQIVNLTTDLNSLSTNIAIEISARKSLTGDGAASVVFRNKIINGNFAINQRVYITATALAAGVYAHDRFKAGAGGCTYTFTQAKPDTLITITAGTLQQIIEDVNCTETAYVLSWTGTAQARFNSGVYGASPQVVIGLSPGTAVTVEFGLGTAGLIQCEAGASKTPFERRLNQIELLLCKRYLPAYSAITSPDDVAQGTTTSSSNGLVLYQYEVLPRVPPTGIITSAVGGFSLTTGSVSSAVTSLGITSAMSRICRISAIATGTPFVIDQPVILFGGFGSQILFTGCEL
jgi:hypothetical protein